MNRRFLLGAAGATLLAAPLARAQHANHGPGLRPAPPSPHRFHNLTQGGAPHHLTPEQEAQRVLASPAPAGPAGRWVPRADMPIPRSEMAWATVWDGRMHVVGGYGEGRVNRAYHTVYDPAANAWLDAAPLPRGANHVAVAADAGRVYAMGGFIEQNRRCDDKAFAYEVKEDRWREIAPLPRPRGAAAAVILDGKVHLIGGGHRSGAGAREHRLA
jgi:N-acetylneuraminic acid mutarotase